VQILAHLGDLLAWTLAMARGEGRWDPREAGGWKQEVARFHLCLEQLDPFLAADEPLRADWAQLLQGPLADAMTHVGPLALLRRMTGAATVGENFYRADIQTGRVGPDQARPRQPF
jgi:hypothetical protein